MISSHPAAELFQMLGPDELHELAEDIKANGLLDPITIVDGLVLDGRNRLAACEMAGVDPRFEEYTGDSPTRYVISKNLRRRHLSESQKAAGAVDALPLFEAEALERKRSHGGTAPGRPADTGGKISTSESGKAREQAGAAFGVSGRYVSDAKAIKAEDEGVFAKVKAGELSIPQAKQILKPHVANNSGNNEWYTPKPYIESARIVLGEIDLDPASCAEANEVVGAKRFYTAEQDGLTKTWKGRVWMNPPYAQPAIGKFCDKLAKSFQAKSITSAIVLVNNATETEWFGTLVEVASAIVFPRSRVKFWMPGGVSGAPLQGQAVVYIGSEPEKFLDEFAIRRNFGWGAMLV